MCQAGGTDSDRWNKIASARYPSVQDPPYAFQKRCEASMPSDEERLTLFHLPAWSLYLRCIGTNAGADYKVGYKTFFNLYNSKPVNHLRKKKKQVEDLNETIPGVARQKCI